MKVRKKILSEAIQVDTAEDLYQVIYWLAVAGHEVDNEALNDLVAAKTWFLRDEGSTVVYLASDEEFSRIFEAAE